MTTKPSFDPLEMWRQALGEFETTLNASATRGMQSEEMPRTLHQMTNAMLGMRHLYEQMEEQRAKLLDMPRRRDVAALAEALQRLEEKVDRLLPAPPVPEAAKPTRGRRPPSEAAAATAAPTAAATVPAAPARPAPPRRRKG